MFAWSLPEITSLKPQLSQLFFLGDAEWIASISPTSALAFNIES
jgi:hypothetical protein